MRAIRGTSVPGALLIQLMKLVKVWFFLMSLLQVDSKRDIAKQTKPETVIFVMCPVLSAMQMKPGSAAL